MIVDAARVLSSILVLTAWFCGVSAAGQDGGAQSEAGRRVALVIGAAAYEADDWALPAAHANAAAVAAALGQVGFDVVVVLDPDHDVMNAAVSGFSGELLRGGETAAFFYYAGRLERVEGVDYLAPVDTRPDDLEALATSAPSLEQIADAMEAAAPGRAFVVIDAPGISAADMADKATGVALAFSQAPSPEPASDATEDPALNAPADVYAMTLARALRAPGLSAERLFARVAGEVAYASDGAQRPGLVSGAKGEPFYFSAPPTRADFEARARESLAWDHARALDTAKAYRDFALGYTDGRFVGDALERLAAREPRRLELDAATGALEEEQGVAATASRALGAVASLALGRAEDDAEPPDLAGGGLWRRVQDEDLLVMDTTKGRILIEMYPELAPQAVARTRELTREGFYDGTPFHRVVDGVLAQAGMRATGEGVATVELPEVDFELAPISFTPVSVADRDRGGIGVYGAEEIVFGVHKGAVVAVRPEEGGAWLSHCPGVASMARGSAASSDTQFYLMRGEAPALDTSETPWGRVLVGLDVIYELRVGDALTPGFAPDVVTRVRVASDLPARARPHVEVFNEAGPGFADFIASLAETLGRAPRACEIRVPVRTLASDAQPG